MNDDHDTIEDLPLDEIDLDTRVDLVVATDRRSRPSRPRHHWSATYATHPPVTPPAEPPKPAR